ncbi:MAG: GNAT family N-acetyltransferase [Nanoarchaeota archaeon]|nr:GNAT family N-acetyltransferase [Nanoarchaeota archaeon]
MIRKAAAKDVEELWKLINSSEELRPRADFSLSKDFIKAYIMHPVNFIFVYMDKGHIIGTIIGEAWKDRSFGYIANLVVHPEHRGRGVGTALYRHAEAHCRKLGLTSMNFFTEVGNRRMQRFAERMGYKRGKRFYYYDKEI